MHLDGFHPGYFAIAAAGTVNDRPHSLQVPL